MSVGLSFDPDSFAGLSDQQIAEKFTEEQILEMLAYARYMDEAPLVARDDFIEFCRYTSPDPNHPFDEKYSLYDVQPHHRLIAEAIDKVMNGEIQYLAISMPPQVGKTETCVRKFLPFHTGKYPWKHLIVGTYNSEFSQEHGDDVRTMINSEPYQRVFPDVALRQGSKAKDHMVTTRGGKMSFIGREGAGSGRPADGLLIDDLLKDDKEAASKTIRDACWNWYTRVAENRCHSLSWRILIATRWSDDDLIARLTDPKNPYYDESVAREWTVINIPNIMDNKEIAEALGKKVGDVLWPERFSRALLERRKRMDPVGFSAMHQGRPTPPDGSFYKQHMIVTYQHASQYPKKVIQYMTGDLAASKDNRADKTCIGIWGLDENDELWLHWDLFWERCATDETVDEIIKRGSTYLILDSWFEKGQLDKAIGPFLEKSMQEAECYFSISRLPVSGNKGLKSKSIQGRMGQRKVHFPEFAPWWERAKEQMLKFTGSGDDKEDDFCLISGTYITMSDGTQKKIECVETGDSVLTPSGPHRVASVRMTNESAWLFEVKFSNGASLTGTRGHRVYSEDQLLFVRMDELCLSECVCVSRDWNTAGENIGATRIPLTGTFASIFNVANHVAVSCIVIFGRTIAGLSLPAMRYTISMKIPQTMLSTTTNASRAASIKGDTCSIRQESKKQQSASWIQVFLRRLSGIGLKLAASGTDKWPYSARVKSATEIPHRASVYNLEVEGAHCYYANGILTHNCDMTALIGQGLGKQVTPNSGQSNIVQFPKAGSFGWTKWAANRERLAAKHARMARGV